MPTHLFQWLCANCAVAMQPQAESFRMYVAKKMADIRGTRGVQAPVLWNVSVHSVMTLCIFIFTIRTVLAEFKNEDAFRAGNFVTLSTAAAARDLRYVDCSDDCATRK